MDEAVVPRKRATTFSSLANKNYRWFWFGILSGFGAVQMQSLARGWLIYDMTKSPLALGLVMGIWGIPVIMLSLFGGTLADRAPKRRLIMAAETGNAILSLTLAVLILSHRIAVWHLMAASGLSGTLVALNMPARQAFILYLVNRKELLNAIALNSVGFNLTGIAGPALAGALIAAIGVGPVYLITTGLALVSVLSISRIPIVGEAKQEANNSFWSGMKEGTFYVRHSPVLLGLLSQVAVMTIFAMPYIYILPVFAADILRVGPGGLGWLNAMVGLGALVGALSVAAAGDLRHKGLTMIGMAILLGATLSLFSFSRHYALSLGLLAAVGLANQVYNALNNTLFQLHSAPEMRGRVMSFNLTIFGFAPLGALPIGAVAEAVGAPLALGGAALLVVVTTLALTAWRPQLRRL